MLRSAFLKRMALAAAASAFLDVAWPRPQARLVELPPLPLREGTQYPQAVDPDAYIYTVHQWQTDRTPIRWSVSEDPTRW